MKYISIFNPLDIRFSEPSMLVRFVLSMLVIGWTLTVTLGLFIVPEQYQIPFVLAGGWMHGVKVALHLLFYEEQA